MPQLSNSDIAKVDAYSLDKGVQVNNTANLPMKIAILAEGNHASNGSMPTAKTRITSRSQAANIFGWGSPIDIICSRLFPKNGGGVNNIETYVFMQPEIGGALSEIQTITPTGTATANVTHTLLIAGRKFLDGGNYDVAINTGDTADVITTKINSVINAVLGCPVKSTLITGIGTAIIHSGAAGSGYAINDTFTVNTGTVLATGKVLTVSAGAVVTFVILTAGTGYSVGTNIATTATLGVGTGFKIDITAVISVASKTETNWKGKTAGDVTINVLTNGNAAGLSYAIAETQAASGSPSIDASLALFANDWFTLVGSSYNINIGSIITSILAYNGNANDKTGQYNPIIMKPAIYIIGDTVDSNTTSPDTVITAALLNEMSIAVASEPNSYGLPMDAMTNYLVNFANVSNDTPNIDIQDMPLLDAPLCSANPSQSSNYTLRNALVELGMSTVIYNNGVYYPQDFVTTYAPVGEFTPTYRYPRDLIIDFNIRYKAGNVLNVVAKNKQIAEDNAIITVANVCKPKDVVSAFVALAKSLESTGFIDSAAYMISTLSVSINPTNKNRFDISFSYDRSGVVRIISSVATTY